MNHLDRLIALRSLGMRTEGLGPETEWDPVSDVDFQSRHNAFWNWVADFLTTEPGEYDDLPDWMTETASESLTDN